MTAFQGQYVLKVLLYMVNKCETHSIKHSPKRIFFLPRQDYIISNLLGITDPFNK